MDPSFIQEVVDDLFPLNQSGNDHPIPQLPTPDIHAIPAVTSDEMTTVIRKLRGKKAPGPDGLPRQALLILMEELKPYFMSLFTDCLRDGCFPICWKQAALVLIVKPGKSLDAPSAFRPICLLDEMAKMLERIITLRLVDHLNNTGPDISAQQFGFRCGRSTIDAILAVRSCTNAIMQ